MAFWQLFYHIVWSTKNRAPFITPTVEPIIYNLLKTKALGLGGRVFALNGIEDHVHMVAAIPPRLAVAQFIGEVKGTASAKFNQQQTDDSPKLYWQNEYGVFSFDRKRLPNVVGYVENQKQHHAQNSLIPVLERTDGGGVQMIQEVDEAYMVNQDDWWVEMLAMDEDG